MMSDYNAINHMEQGGARQVIGSGGSLDVESGGEIDVESGGALKIGGVAITATAAEVNKLAGMTSSKAELNKLTGVTADPAELNIMDCVTATAAEINAVDLSAVGALLKVKKIHVPAGDWSTETDSTWDLPAKALVLDVFIDVTTGQAKTVDIGTKSGEAGGDADGFVNDLDLTNVGIVRAQAALDGGSAYWATNTRGALLSNFVAGTNADDRGLYQSKPYPSTAATAKSVTYTTSTAITAVFDIYIVYIELG